VSDKLQRFTQRARRVLALAQEEAERMKHAYIGTEHLLLGLMKEEGGVASRVLRELGLETRRVQEIVERLTGANKTAPTAKVDLSPGTKRVLELAVDEARRMGHHYIGTEHLLLGLVRQNEGVAIDVLKKLGVSAEQIRRQTRRVLQESPTQQSNPPASQQTQKPERQAVAPGGEGRQKKEKAKTPLVDQLATDLTALAEENKLDPVVGREQEIERVIQILARRTKNNPALIGEPGVGKTAIVERAGATHRRRRHARAPARQAGVAARRRVAGGRHHVPRPIRGAPQARDRGAQAKRRHTVHRRSPHAGGRRRGRLVGGCGQHPQTRPRPR